MKIEVEEIWNWRNLKSKKFEVEEILKYQIADFIFLPAYLIRLVEYQWASPVRPGTTSSANYSTTGSVITGSGIYQFPHKQYIVNSLKRLDKSPEGLKALKMEIKVHTLNQSIYFPCPLSCIHNYMLTRE